MSMHAEVVGRIESCYRSLMSERTPKRGDRVETLMTALMALGVAAQAAVLVEMVRRLFA